MLTSSEMAGHLLTAAAGAYGEGRFPAASTFARAAFLADPTAVASNLIALAELGQGDKDAAVEHLQLAAQLDPLNAEYPNNLGFVLHAMGDLAGARAVFERALEIDPNMPNAANNLGSILEKIGDDEAAIALYRRALSVDPASVEARDNLLLVCTRVAPQWHFPMIADADRNGAYADAIARAAPGRHVLDIGSGSGLLAMMAARAGAAHVATCEMQPVIAAVAKRAVERNALQGQIDVWSAKSDQLQVGVHIPRRAQVLVTETFSSGLLSEHVLPTVEDAFERLLEPDAVVIPRRAAAMGYLVGGRFLEDHFFSAAWDGLELSEFDFLAPAKLGMHLDRVPHDVLSDPFEIFGFDLADGRFPAERRPLLVEATAQGRCIGVAQWIRLELDAQSVYENRPTAEAGANGWMHVIYPFIRPVDVKPGDLVPLVAGHNRAEIVVGLNEAP